MISGTCPNLRQKIKLPIFKPKYFGQINFVNLIYFKILNRYAIHLDEICLEKKFGIQMISGTCPNLSQKIKLPIFKLKYFGQINFVNLIYFKILNRYAIHLDEIC